MKKTLLLVLFTVFTCAYAQQRLAVPVKATATATAVAHYQKVLRKRLFSSASQSALLPKIKSQKPTVFCYRPGGIYFLGPDEHFSAPGGRCIAPANVPLSTEAFVNSNKLEWSYYTQDEDTHEVTLQTQTESELFFSLPKGRYPAPVLRGHAVDNAPEADSVYTFTTDSIDYGNGYNERYYACNFNPMADVTTVATNYFYINDSTANAGLKTLISSRAEGVKLKSIAEFFEYSGKPYTLMGGAAHLYSDTKLKPSDFKIVFTKWIDDGDSLKSHVLEDSVHITQIIPLEGNVYYLRFELPSKPKIDAPISMEFSATNDTAKFTPLIIPQQHYDMDNEGGYCMITIDFTLRGEEHKDEYLNVDGYPYGKGIFMSWMMGLFMTYDTDQIDGIQTVNPATPAESTSVYTITGRKLKVSPTELQSGCYIINGKKVMIR